VVSGDPPETAQTDSPGPPGSPQDGGDSTERRSIPNEIGDLSFPGSIRGYDRGAVDAYVSRVQHLVAELEVTRSPEAAVKHALEQVGEQTKSILAQAGETAEQITVAARQDAEESTTCAKHEADGLVANAKAVAAEILARSKAEAEATVAQAQKEAAEHLQRSQEEVAALQEEAEARMRELHTDTETIRHERSQLLDDLREFAARVEEVASVANARFPRPQASDQAGEEKLQPGTASDAAGTEVTAMDKPTAEAGDSPTFTPADKTRDRRPR
jgi:cell division septum initiation protein DivIVA